jgi:hypothetical protein
MPNSFDKNVFLNCPFDKDFLPFLKTLIFTVYRLGFNPRIASERSDSGESRLDKIKSLIESSRYSIHDLSRFRATTHNEFYRLNMPFEIGLDLGCRSYHRNAKYRNKRTLILETEKHSSKIALSDLSGVDPKCYDSSPQELVYQVRTWFSELGESELPSASAIWDDYNIFQADLYESKSQRGFNKREIDQLPISEFVDCIESWLRSRITIENTA